MDLILIPIYNEGVRGLLHSRYALASAILCSLGGLTFGYDQGVISNVRYFRFIYFDINSLVDPCHERVPGEIRALCLPNWSHK